MMTDKLSSQDKIRAAVEVCGVERVHGALTDFLKYKKKLGLANDYEIQKEGYIYNTWECEDMTDGELDDFVDWAKEENK